MLDDNLAQNTLLPQELSFARRLLNSAVARDAVWVLLAQGLTALILLYADSQLFKGLPINDRGLFSAGLNYQAILMIFADMGIAIMTIRVGAEYLSRGKTQEANLVFQRALILRICLGITVASVAFLCNEAVSHQLFSGVNQAVSGSKEAIENPMIRTGLGWGAIAGIMGLSVLTWGVDVAQAQRRFSFYFFLQIIASVLRAFILIFIIRRFGCDLPVASGGPGYIVPELLLWGVASSACMGAMLSVFFHRSTLQPPALTDKGYEDVKKEIYRFLPYAATVTILAGLGPQIELLLIQPLLGEKSTAVYDGARKLAMLLPLLSTAMATVLLPRAAALNSLEACQAYAQKALRVSLPLAIASAGSLAILAEILIPLLWGDRYSESISILRWLCLGFAFNVLFNPLTLVLYPLRRENALLVLNAMSIVLSLILGFVLIPNFGPEGAAWSVVIVKAVTMLSCGGVVLWALKHPHKSAFVKD